MVVLNWTVSLCTLTVCSQSLFGALVGRGHILALEIKVSGVSLNTYCKVIIFSLNTNDDGRLMGCWSSPALKLL